MANYEHITRLEFVEKVQQKLGEDGVFWPISDIEPSIKEALLTFGALSNFWQDNIFIRTEENKRLYDLFTNPHTNINKIKPTLTYGDIVDWLNRDLIESISPASPNSEFFSLNTFLKAIDVKYNSYQQITGLVLDYLEENIPPNQNIFVLPDNLIDIVRISIVDEFEIETVLDKVDEEEINRFDSSSLVATGMPEYYSIIYDKVKRLKFYPAPNVVMKLRIIFVTGRDTSVESTVETIINLPNNLVPYIKFGVEADIFSNDGAMNDFARANYCKERWQEGLIVGKNYNSILTAESNLIMIELDSISNVDTYNEGEKERTSPTVLGIAGFNLFITNSLPSEVIYDLSILTTINAPIPLIDGDYVDVSIEYVDMLADYVVHLISMKVGADKLLATSNLKNYFLKTSLEHNRRLILRGLTFEDLMRTTKKQERDSPNIPEEQ